MRRLMKVMLELSNSHLSVGKLVEWKNTGSYYFRTFAHYYFENSYYLLIFKNNWILDIDLFPSLLQHLFLSIDCADLYELCRFPRAGTANAKSNLKMVTFQLNEKGQICQVQTLELIQPLSCLFPMAEYMARAGWTPNGSQWVETLKFSFVGRATKIVILVYGFNCWTAISRSWSWCWFLSVFSDLVQLLMEWRIAVAALQILLTNIHRFCAAFITTIGSM